MMNVLNFTDENEFRLETSEHEDADSDDLPLSYLQKLSQDSFDFENLKLSSKVNNSNNVKDTYCVSNESSKEIVLKNCPGTVESTCLTPELLHVSGSQSVETKCRSSASDIDSYDVFHLKSVQCDITSKKKVTQYDMPKNTTHQSSKLTSPPPDSQLVSQITQNDIFDDDQMIYQIAQSVCGVQTSKSSHISIGIQCDLDDGISNNVVSSSNPLPDFQLVCVNRCVCCKRDLEACEFSDTINSVSERITENNDKEKETDLEKKLSSPKGNEHLCEGGEINNASQNTITSSKNISSPVVSTTNRDGMKTNKDAQPLNNAEQTAVLSSQNHRNVCITTSTSDGGTNDIYLENESKKADNSLQSQQLPNVITRNEYSSAFEPVEKAHYVASWINNLVPESALSPCSLAEETEVVLQSNERVSKTALLQCSKRPVKSIKRRLNRANKCGSDTNKISSISGSSTSESSPETVRTKRCGNKIVTTNNRRNTLMDHSCKKRKESPVSLHLDVEERNGISLAIPAERVDFVLSWINNLVPECGSLPPGSNVRHRETEDVIESNHEISKAGSLQKYNKHCAKSMKKRMKSVMNCGGDASDESSGLSLSSPEMLRNENNQSNRSLLHQHNRVGDCSLSSISKSSNIELNHELEREDLECAKAFEEFLASYYYKDMKEYERTERNKFLYFKPKLNEESTLRQMTHHNKSFRESNYNNSGRKIQQKFVVQESQSDNSSDNNQITVGVRSPGKRKYLCLSGVKPDDNQIESKRNVRQSYTIWEQKKIINYIIEKNKFSSVKGCVLWRDMERAKVCERTWQSMKEHFRKQILPRIERYKLEPDILKKFVSLRK